MLMHGTNTSTGKVGQLFPPRIEAKVEVLVSDDSVREGLLSRRKLSLAMK